MKRNVVPATSEAVAEAARLLRDGNLVAFPTETVYGLGGDARSETAVARIFAAKGRPRFNPLIVHVPGLTEAEPLAEFDTRARESARRFWPGPLTLVLRRRADAELSLLASAGLDTVALRAPAHPVAQQLLRAAARPIAAPSANRSGRVSPTMAAHVAAELGTLARHDDDTLRLAATLRAYLEEQASPRRTARRLGVHENTVKNRVRAIEDLRGRPADQRVAETLLALRLADVLDRGPA